MLPHVFQTHWSIQKLCRLVLPRHLWHGHICSTAQSVKASGVQKVKGMGCSSHFALVYFIAKKTLFAGRSVV